MHQNDNGDIVMSRREYSQIMATLPASHAAGGDGGGIFGWFGSSSEDSGPGLLDDFEIRHEDEHVIMDPEIIDLVGDALDVERPNDYDNAVRIRVAGDVAVKGEDIEPASVSTEQLQSISAAPDIRIGKNSDGEIVAVWQDGSYVGDDFSTVVNQALLNYDYNPQGAWVHVNAGEYEVSERLKLRNVGNDTGRVTFSGAGKGFGDHEYGTRLIVPSGYSDDRVIAPYRHFCEIKDLEINGNKENVSNTVSAIWGNFYDITISNVCIQKMTGDGIVVETDKHSLIKECWIELLEGTGIKFTKDSNKGNSQIRDCHLAVNDRHIELNSSDDTTTSSYRNPLTIRHTAMKNAASGATDAVMVNGLQDVLFDNCIFTDNEVTNEIRFQSKDGQDPYATVKNCYFKQIEGDAANFDRVINVSNGFNGAKSTFRDNHFDSAYGTIFFGSGNIADATRRNNVGYVSEETGSETQSGDGSTTTFDIPHGLDAAPNVHDVWAESADAAGNFYVDASATGANIIRIVYSAAPASGTDNLTWGYHASISP